MARQNMCINLKIVNILVNILALVAFDQRFHMKKMKTRFFRQMEFGE